MAFNCLELVSGELGNEIEYKNGTNKTIVWLTKDSTTVFDEQFWTIAWIPGFIIITLFIISMPFICYKHYKDVDTKRRMEKMKAMGINTVSKKDVTPILDPYCNYSRDVMDIIFKFADIKIEQELIEYSYTIIQTSAMDKRLKVYCPWIIYLLIGSILIPPYFPLFFSIQHLKDSYESYIEIECIHYFTGMCTKRSCRGKGTQRRCRWVDYDCDFQREFDFEGANICDDETDIDFDDYVFVGKYEDYGGDKCFVNKDTFKIRGNDSGYCCCKESFGRCGSIQCPPNCTDGDCANCWGYWCCILPMVIAILVLCCLMGIIVSNDLDTEYIISPINGYDHLV